MRSLACIACTLMAAVLAGCGSDETLSADKSTPPPPAPHGGTLVYFRHNDGVVEVVKKPVSKPKENVDAELSLYFYKEPFKPFPMPPTSVSLALAKKKIPLKLKGDAFVTPSAPALFANQDLDGALTLEIEGKLVTVPLWSVPVGDR